MARSSDPDCVRRPPGQAAVADDVCVLQQERLLIVWNPWVHTWSLREPCRCRYRCRPRQSKVEVLFSFMGSGKAETDCQTAIPGAVCDPSMFRPAKVVTSCADSSTRSARPGPARSGARWKVVHRSIFLRDATGQGSVCLRSHPCCPTRTLHAEGIRCDIVGVVTRDRTHTFAIGGGSHRPDQRYRDVSRHPAGPQTGQRQDRSTIESGRAFAPPIRMT